MNAPIRSKPVQSHTELTASGLRSTSSEPFSIVAPVEVIRGLLCGPQDHNEHCKGWRWHLYVQDSEKCFQSAAAEMRKMHAERRALRNEGAV